MTVKEMVKDCNEKGLSKRKTQVRIGMKIGEMIESGKSCSEIGQELGISESSVRAIKESYDRLQAVKKQ